MSWPEVKKTTIFRSCFEPQSSRARVVAQSLKWRRSASSADAMRSSLSAQSAVECSATLAGGDELSAVWRVEIDAETGCVSVARSNNAWRWYARTADAPTWCVRLVEIARSVHLSAEFNATEATALRRGAAACQPSETDSAHLENGSNCADESTHAIEAIVSDAENVQSEESQQFTTSGVGRNSQSCGWPIQIVCSSVSDVIAGFIQEQTPSADSFSCELTLVSGWTRYGTREDGTVYELSDTARYRLCGNGVASVCAEWIAERLARALGLPSAMRRGAA